MDQPGGGVYTYNPNTQNVETRVLWGQPGLHGKTLSQNYNKQKKNYTFRIQKKWDSTF